MKGEERFATYYAFLSLFTFSMLGLVCLSNIFQIYIFWELVGVSSFLLIGYYYDKPSAVAALKKHLLLPVLPILVSDRYSDSSFYGRTLDFRTLIERLTLPIRQNCQVMTTASFLGYFCTYLGIDFGVYWWCR